jgi:hypothetical protein
MRLSLTLLFILTVLLAGETTAAILDIRFNPNQGTVADAAYPKGSTATVGTTSVEGLVPTMTGRGYGVEVASSERWGIQAGPLSWDAKKAGWTVLNGFAPDKVGSTVSTSGKVEVPASFISIMLSGVVPGTVFRDVGLTFSEVTFLRPSQAWAGTSADGFATASRLSFNSRGGERTLSVTLPEFTWMGGEPMEIRIYGVVGSDQGAFNVLSVSGNIEQVATVPEPDVRMLITAVALGALTALRRRSKALPRLR